MEDSGPNAHKPTLRPNIAQPYRITASAEKQEKSGTRSHISNRFNILPHHLVIVPCTLKHTRT